MLVWTYPTIPQRFYSVKGAYDEIIVLFCWWLLTLHSKIAEQIACALKKPTWKQTYTSFSNYEVIPLWCIMCNVQHKPFPVVRGFFGCPTKSPDSLGKIPCCKKNTNTTARWASARVGLIRHAKPFKGESLPFAGIEPLTTQILKTCLQYIQAAIQVHWPSFHVKTIIIKDLLHRQVKEYNQTPVVAFNVSGQQHQFQIRNVTSETYPMNQFSFLGFCLIFHHNWTKNHWGAIFTIHNWCNFSTITPVGKPIITVHHISWKCR